MEWKMDIQPISFQRVLKLVEASGNYVHVMYVW